MTDVQTQDILDKARKILQVTLDPLARKVLEIDINAESAKNENHLTRLIRSLDQYVNKQRDIKYVGLVGHYSSGKSSTINSLLALSGSSNQRDTGLNPTDKAITLLTHPKNSSLLILMNREGGSVPIRTSFIENDLLNDLVLSDTPGSGDPEVVNEMIQDFLPICDLIFYFIASTNPLDQADLPLLRQKTLKLPFIPISYIVTRADEFRADRSRPLSNENIDQPKKDTFIGKLISRIKQNINSEDVVPNNFIFIDNESNFNIKELRSRLTDSALTLDQQALLKMHGHKVEYYRSSLKSIYLFFISSIDTKIRQSNGFVKTASENITRFDKSVELNNEKLRLLWAKSENSLKESFNEEKRALADIMFNSYPSQLSYDKVIVTERKLINQIIESQSNGYFGKLMLDLNGHLKQRIREIKHNILENIESANILTDDITHLFPARLDFDIKEYSLEVDFTKLGDSLNALSQKISVILNEVRNSLRFKIGQIKVHSNKEFLIGSLVQMYENGKASIFDNFDQYFERIQMYRSTVLTKNTKEAIERLRIGTQLDELDYEFADDYVTNMKNRAVDVVYAKNEGDIGNLRKAIESYISRATDLRSHLEKISINKSELFPELLRENVDVSILLSDLVRQKEEFVNGIYQSQLSNVLENQAKIFKQHNQTIQAARTYRKRWVIRWSSLIAALSISVYGGLKFFNVTSPTTTLGEILVSLATTGIVYGIGLLYGMFKTDVKKIVAESKIQFVKKGRAEITQSFGESFWDDLSKKMTEEKATSSSTFVKGKMNEKMDPLIAGLIESNQLVLGELLTVFGNVRILVSEYETKLQQFYNKFSIIFAETDESLGKIGDITKQIKEFSIKPSFDLLEETTSNLEDVKSKIKLIMD